MREWAQGERLAGQLVSLLFTYIFLSLYRAKGLTVGDDGLADR